MSSTRRPPQQYPGQSRLQSSEERSIGGDGILWSDYHNILTISFYFRLVYESFKYFLKQDTTKVSREETIDELWLAQQRSQSQAASRTGGESEAERRDSRLWDQIVTDLPQVQVVRAESQVNTDLVVTDRTFPGYRT